jgi:hypothetical protein
MARVDRVDFALEAAVEQVLVENAAERCGPIGGADERDRRRRQQRPQVVVKLHARVAGAWRVRAAHSTPRASSRCARRPREARPL